MKKLIVAAALAFTTPAVAQDESPSTATMQFSSQIDSSCSQQPIVDFFRYGSSLRRDSGVEWMLYVMEGDLMADFYLADGCYEHAETMYTWVIGNGDARQRQTAEAGLQRALARRR